MEGTWSVIPVENIISGRHFDALAGSPLIVQGEVCAFMKPWDDYGWSVISFVELDRAAEPTLIPIFERKRYFAVAHSTARLHREKAKRR